MKNIFAMEMTPDLLMLKSPSLEGGIAMAQDYEKKIASRFK